MNNRTEILHALVRLIYEIINTSNGSYHCLFNSQDLKMSKDEKDRLMWSLLIDEEYENFRNFMRDLGFGFDYQTVEGMEEYEKDGEIVKEHGEIVDVWWRENV